MLPVQVIMVALFKLVTGLGLYGSYWAVILPTAASAFGMFLARQFILGHPARPDRGGPDRRRGRTCGSSPGIVLPLSKPLIAVLFFMSLLQSWNDFAWPLIALKENELFTLPIGLLYLQGQFGSDYGAHDGVRAAQRRADGGAVPGLPALLRPGLRAQRDPLSLL